jgi:hypothetical protein
MRRSVSCPRAHQHRSGASARAHDGRNLIGQGERTHACDVGRSNGSRDLGTSVETSADFAVTSHISVNAFLAHIRGGPVATGTFDGDRLWYGTPRAS